MQGVPVYLCKAYRTLGLTHFLALNWSIWSGISNLQLRSGPLIHPVSSQISSEEAASLSIDSAFCRQLIMAVFARSPAIWYKSGCFFFSLTRSFSFGIF